MKQFNEKTQLDEIIANTLDKIKTISTSETIIGETIKLANGKMVIPISKINIGFIVGGGEYSDLSTRRVAERYPMACGTGGGVSISPVGFLIDDGTEIRYVDVEDKTTYQTIVNMINKIISNFGDKNNENK